MKIKSRVDMIHKSQTNNNCFTVYCCFAMSMMLWIRWMLNRTMLYIVWQAMKFFQEVPAQEEKEGEIIDDPALQVKGKAITPTKQVRDYKWPCSTRPGQSYNIHKTWGEIIDDPALQVKGQSYNIHKTEEMSTYFTF